MTIYKTIRCVECDCLLWSARARELFTCPECENPDEDDYSDLEERLDKLLEQE